MLYINISKEELGYFDELQQRFPDNVLITKEQHGFDMATDVQIVIDFAEIAKVSLPYIITAVETVLLYRIQKEQNRIKEKELELQKQKLVYEQENANRDVFEITYSSNGDNKYLIKTSDVDKLEKNPEQLEKFMSDFQKKLEASSGQT